MQEISQVEPRRVPGDLAVWPVSLDAVGVERAAIVQRDAPRFAVGLQVCWGVELFLATTASSSVQIGHTATAGSRGVISEGSSSPW